MAISILFIIFAVSEVNSQFPLEKVQLPPLPNEAYRDHHRDAPKVLPNPTFISGDGLPGDRLLSAPDATQPHLVGIRFMEKPMPITPRLVGVKFVQPPEPIRPRLVGIKFVPRPEPIRPRLVGIKFVQPPRPIKPRLVGIKFVPRPEPITPKLVGIKFLSKSEPITSQLGGINFLSKNDFGRPSLDSMKFMDPGVPVAPMLAQVPVVQKIKIPTPLASGMPVVQRQSFDRPLVSSFQIVKMREPFRPHFRPFPYPYRPITINKYRNGPFGHGKYQHYRHPTLPTTITSFEASKPLIVLPPALPKRLIHGDKAPIYLVQTKVSAPVFIMPNHGSSFSKGYKLPQLPPVFAPVTSSVLPSFHPPEKLPNVAPHFNLPRSGEVNQAEAVPHHDNILSSELTKLSPITKK